MGNYSHSSFSNTAIGDTFSWQCQPNLSIVHCQAPQTSPIYGKKKYAGKAFMQAFNKMKI